MRFVLFFVLFIVSQSRKIHNPLPELLPPPSPTPIIEPRPDELIVECVEMKKLDMRWPNAGRFEVQVWWDDGQVKGWQN